MVTLRESQQQSYRERGHLTVAGVFPPDRMAAAIDDAGAWAVAFQADLGAAERAWYLDRSAAGTVLRKLDNPVHERSIFRELAGAPVLLDMVADLIGPPAGILFSQIFFKPPEGGGAKPAHQDNFYFGPDDRGGLVTAWIALDDATPANGCLEYAEGSNRGPVLARRAPADEPFNLQIPADACQSFAWTAAPVSAGGVSFHHGNTLHRSCRNRSDRWRRAVAVHYYARGVELVDAALAYDRDKFVPVD